MLCWALADTGRLGKPEEYFLDGDPSSFPPGWDFWERSPLAIEHGITDRRAYLDLVYRLGTTPNGVFAAKLMWNNLPWVTARLNALAEFAGMTTAQVFPLVFPGLRVVHVVRRDRVRQAISWAKAVQDGVWFASDDAPAQPSRTPEYSFEFISGLEAVIAEGEVGWRGLYDELGVTPYEVVYEDLDTPDGYDAAVRGIADHVGVEASSLVMPSPRSHRQADHVNDEWFERYTTERLTSSKDRTR
jgi:trehalose 2-sulfotransferase